MNNHMRRFSIASLITLSWTVVGLVVSQAQEPSVSGVYSLIEVNGAELPAVSWTKNSNGDRCTEEILEGALFLDSKGRFAAFVTVRDVCLQEKGFETEANKESVIWPGSYKISGNQVTLNYDFEQWSEPDQAAINGDLLVLNLEGVGDYEGQSTEIVFRRE